MFRYIYFVGCLIILLFWLFLFLRRQDLRKEMLVMSLIIAPAALSDFLFVPEYWEPLTLFGLPIGIEGFLFCFGVGGIAAVLYEVFFPRIFVLFGWERKIKSFWRRAFLGLGPAVVLLLYFFAGWDFMYSVLVGLLIAACIIVIFRGDLLLDVVLSGLFFSVLYTFVFILLLLIFPNMLSMWALENLSGVFFFGVPLEEVLWALLTGAVAGPLYEYWQGYRLAG